VLTATLEAFGEAVREAYLDPRDAYLHHGETNTFDILA